MPKRGPLLRSVCLPQSVDFKHKSLESSEKEIADAFFLHFLSSELVFVLARDFKRE